MTAEQRTQLETYISYGYEVHINKWTPEGEHVFGKIDRVFTVNEVDNMEVFSELLDGEKLCILNKHSLGANTYEEINVALDDIRIEDVRVSKRIDWILNKALLLGDDQLGIKNHLRGYEYHKSLDEILQPILLDLWINEEGIKYRNFLYDLANSPKTVEYKMAYELFTYLLRIGRVYFNRIKPLSDECKRYANKLNCDIESHKQFLNGFKVYLHAKYEEVLNNEQLEISAQCQFFIECFLNTNNMGIFLTRDNDSYKCASFEDLIKKREYAKRLNERRRFKG